MALYFICTGFFAKGSQKVYIYQFLVFRLSVVFFFSKKSLPLLLLVKVCKLRHISVFMLIELSVPHPLWHTISSCYVLVSVHLMQQWTYTLFYTIFIHESIKILVNVYSYRYVRYNSLPGPDLWCNVHQCWSTCGSDVRQSPINIDTSQTTKRHFDDLKIFNLHPRVPARVFNNGMHM